MKILKIGSDWTAEAVDVESFKAMHEVLGGYIEPVPGVMRVPSVEQSVSMLVDEDGGPKDLPVNELATAMAYVITGLDQLIRGTAIFVGECEDSYCSLTGEAEEVLKAMAEWLVSEAGR